MNFQDQSNEYFRTIQIDDKELDVWDCAAAFKAFFIATQFKVGNPTDLNCEEKIEWFKAQPRGFELLSKMQSVRKQGISASKREYWMRWLSIDDNKNYRPLSKEGK